MNVRRINAELARAVPTIEIRPTTNTLTETPSASVSKMDVKASPSPTPQPLNPKPPEKLDYLNDFTETELKELEVKYQKTRFQLDHVIAEYWKRFWFERTLQYGALGSNFLYMLFRGITSTPGIQQFVNFVAPSVTVSNSVGYGVGIALAAPGTLTYIASYSAKKAAILSILDSKAKPAERDQKVCSWLDSIKFAAKNTVSVSVYATAGMALVTPLIDQLNSLSPIGKWAAIAAITCFGYKYNHEYFDSSFVAGAKFWWNEENRPWGIGEVARGNYAIPFELFQHLISTGSRAYPNYYWAALSIGQAIGGWIPALAVGILTLIHSLCSLYPASYNYYMKTSEKIRECLKEQMDPSTIEELLQEQIQKLNLNNLSNEKKAELKQKITDTLVQLDVDTLIANIRADRGWFALFKEKPIKIASTGIATGIGTYFGAQFVAPALFAAPPIAATVGCGALFATLFGAAYYRAEDNREVNEKALKKLLKMDDAKPDAPLTGVDVIAAGFSVCNALSAGTSTVGSTALIDDATPLLNSAMITVATKSGLNSILFNYPKVAQTLNTCSCCGGCSVCEKDDIDLEEGLGKRITHG